MKGCIASGLVLLLMSSACNVGDAEVEAQQSDVEIKPLSGMDLETLVQDAPVIRGFVAAGSGCRTLGPPVVTGNTVTIVLNGYIAEREGPGIARATCDVAVELTLPSGVSVSLDEVVYRGFSGGALARSTFFREYFFAGEFAGDRRFTVIDYDATGVLHVVQNDSDAYMTDFGEFTSLDRVPSARLGGKLTWRTNTALTVRNDFAGSFALASLDTVDAVRRHFVTFRFGSLSAEN